MRDHDGNAGECNWQSGKMIEQSASTRRYHHFSNP
jgi:hypothetical protein